VSAFALASLAAATPGCSSGPLSSSTSSSEAGIGSAGHAPAVIDARANPSTIEVNQHFQPMTPAEVLADVKDFAAPIKSVTLKFKNVPLEVPMENVGGTTYRAQLTARQLEMLSVSGKTIKYDAQVIAKDAKGQIGVSSQPISVAVKTANMGPGATG
jgi:hypothetical protein